MNIANLNYKFDRGDYLKNKSKFNYIFLFVIERKRRVWKYNKILNWNSGIWFKKGKGKKSKI